MFVGDQKNGGDITISAHDQSTDCNEAASYVSMIAAPCDFLTTDMCDTYSKSASINLHIHVPIPAQKAPSSNPATPTGVACAQLQACCDALPSIANSVAPGCTTIASKGQVPACSQGAPDAAQEAPVLVSARPHSARSA